MSHTLNWMTKNSVKIPLERLKIHRFPSGLMWESDGRAYIDLVENIGCAIWCWHIDKGCTILATDSNTYSKEPPKIKGEDFNDAPSAPQTYTNSKQWGPPLSMVKANKSGNWSHKGVSPYHKLSDSWAPKPSLRTNFLRYENGYKNSNVFQQTQHIIKLLLQKSGKLNALHTSCQWLTLFCPRFHPVERLAIFVYKDVFDLSMIWRRSHVFLSSFFLLYMRHEYFSVHGDFYLIMSDQS